MDAAVDNRLGRDLDLTRRDDFLHDMAAVVVNQEHARSPTDSSLPCRLTDHGVRRSAYRFEVRLFLAIPNLDPEIVLCGVRH
jgi:hypothetical protein